MLASMLGRMPSPTTGTVYLSELALYDLSVADPARMRRENIGFIFQTLPYLTALENVQISLCLAGVAASEQLERAHELLKRVGLVERVHHLPRELSIGQQQRAALARTLANQPVVVLADEPTGDLDPESRATVLDLFDDLHCEGRIIIDGYARRSRRRPSEVIAAN
jgi:putative ABC transport system ATP-binding protein